MTPPKKQTNYASAGVDIGRGDEAVRRIKKHVETTFTKDVLRGIGSFAGALDVTSLKDYKNPVLLASIDGVGTKTVIAAMAGKWEGVGHDIVNHSGNDLVCQGAAPLLFLDYLAASRLDPAIIEIIVKGMCDACRELSCVLIGGETAEMPRVYTEGSYDIAGAIIGVVERDRMITGDQIAEGDVLVALPSNGLHTNGYSLARKVLFEDAKLPFETVIHANGARLDDALLVPHESYTHSILALHDTVGLKGVAHITGGGIAGNLIRILPSGLGACIETNAIRNPPPIFEFIRRTGEVSSDAMFEAFNMGVGMIVAVEPSKRDAILKEAKGYFVIGEITRSGRVEIV